MPVAVPLIAAGVGAAGTIASSRAQSSAARSAANASQAATDASIAEQRRQFDIAQQNQQPWLTTGTSALNQLAALYSLNGQGGQQQDWASYVQNNPDILQAFNEGRLGNTTMAEAGRIHYRDGGQAEGRTAPAVTSPMDAFTKSPDYQFRLNEQNRNLTARNSALGIQDSGAAQKAALQYSGNLASGEFNNYANRLASLAGVGQSAANQSASLGQNFANNFGNLQTQNAQNLGSSYATQGAINGNMWGNLAGIGSGLINKYPFGGQSATAPGGSLWGLY